MFRHSMSANIRAWGSVVVKALRYKSEGPGIDSRCRRRFFSVASDSSMCPGVDSASKNEYQVNLRGKGGRCVRLTTYYHTVPLSSNLGALTIPRPLWACMACYGSPLNGCKYQGDFRVLGISCAYIPVCLRLLLWVDFLHYSWYTQH
jgi:hypothetical protein